MKKYAFSVIGGIKVNSDTNDSHLYHAIASNLLTPDSNILAEKVFGRQLTIDEIHTTAKEATEYASTLLKDKRPTPPAEGRVNITAQGVPGSGKSESLIQIYESWQQDKKNRFAFFGYDRGGVIETLGVYKAGLAHINAQRADLSEQDYFDKRLALRDLCRHATAVGYDLAKNDALIAGVNTINDTTVSSPFAIKTMEIYAQHGYRNDGLAFQAPLEDSLHRCFRRAVAINVEEEVLGKRGPVMKNYPAYVDEIVRSNGNMTQYYTPSEFGKFSTQVAFNVVGGVLESRTDSVLRNMIESAEYDSKADELQGAPLINEGTAAFIDKLECIATMPIGERIQPTTLG